MTAFYGLAPEVFLAMPECLLLSYHQNLDRLRAERQLDAAQAASVPHLSKEGHKSWYRHVSKRVARRVVATRSMAARAGGDGGGVADEALFTVDGRPVNKDGLARWLAVTFGAPLLPLTRST